MKTIIKTLVLVSISLSLAIGARACTTFCLSDSTHLVFGRNYDFPTGYGLVVINKRNVKKTTAMLRPPEKTMEWTSKYGSITFNQIGQEFPHGGINEKGLVIEMMWLEGTRYPEADERYGLTELQWIQYQLDNAASVEEVLASREWLRISNQSTAPLHFLVCDANGNTASIEYIEGKMVFHRGEDLPLRVLSNDMYGESLKYTESRSESGGKKNTPWTSSSPDRFARAAYMIKNYEDEDIIDYSFDILKAVSQGSYTHWSIVYDISNLSINYRTLPNQEIRSLSLEDFDFSCGSPALYVDINENIPDIERAFRPCNYQTNRDLLENVCNNVKFLSQMPPEARDMTANYPETTSCAP
ncbi:MAG: linear amide C-N hydrolase [Bacteroidales bacterium]|nr:linear amide C-N hydrolase [Bacteroidales bacterium]